MFSFWPNGLYQATRNLPLTRGFLLEAEQAFQGRILQGRNIV
jgi:hypothetical protein